MALMQHWFSKERCVALILHYRENVHIQKLLINPFNAIVVSISPENADVSRGYRNSLLA